MVNLLAVILAVYGFSGKRGADSLQWFDFSFRIRPEAEFHQGQR